MNKANKKGSLLFILWISIFAISITKKTLQNDTFYTIKIGELIINNGIDMLDHFSWHILPYTYPHWLYDSIIYIIYNYFGFTGIYISSIILFITLLSIVYKVNLKICKNNLMSAISTFVCTLAIANFITARAQVISYILFASELYFIESFLISKNKKYLLGLLLISLLICNMHVAVWPLYFILYIPYLAEYVISIICKKIKLKKENKFINYLKKHFILEDNSNIKYLFYTMLLSTITGLLTPIGLTPYTYTIKTFLGNSMSYINEHQMLTLKDSPFTIIVAVETLFLSFLSKTKLRDFFMICGLIIMNIISIRHMAFLALIGTICFSRIFTTFLDSNLLDTTKIALFFKKKLVIITSFIIVITVSSFFLYNNLNKPFVDPIAYPIEATKYIKDNIDISKMRIYNEYNFGSYLLLNSIPVFIDSRADLYTKEFSGYDYDIFDDYQNMPSIYTEKFEFYNITHALIYKNEGSMYSLLSHDKNYKLLYDDDNFALFEKIGQADYIITYSGNVNFTLKPKL